VNPTRLELLSPGRAFGDQPEIVTAPSPRFQWSADEGVVGGLGSYRIKVVEVGAAASAEEAMQGFASFEGTTPSTSLLYPGSVSALPLQPGQSYAWQVTREVKTSGGVQSVESPIYWFRMAGGNDQTAASKANGGDVGISVVLRELAIKLGLQGDLSGFRPTGELLIDGQSVSIENLEALLRAIQSGRVSPLNFTIR
jgi:hypothetical protein